MRIIFFDSHCPMCHAWVKRILRNDPRGIFRFSPLESRKAEELLSPVLPGYLEEDTLVLYDDGKAYMRSEAAIKIFDRLGWPYSFFRLGYLVPRSIRDAIYRWVAARRYRFGDRYDACPLPPEKWKSRFL